MNKTIATTLIVAAASAAAAILPATSSSAAAIPDCPAAWLHDTSGGVRAAGEDVLTVDVKDTGPACWLPSWPGLGLENSRRERLHSAVTREGSPSHLLLLYGLSARFRVTFGGDSTAGAEAVTYLRVWTGSRYSVLKVGPVDVYRGELDETAYAAS